MVFVWDENNNRENIRKHGISFRTAQYAFLDQRRIIAIDTKHSRPAEKRYFCFGEIASRVITVRFTIRGGKIRIFGAGAWREGRNLYEKRNKI